MKTANSGTGLKVKSTLKADSVTSNHNQTTVRSLKVKTGLKAGRLAHNHNQTVVRGFRVRTNVQAGQGNSTCAANATNHNETQGRVAAIRSANWQSAVSRIDNPRPSRLEVGATALKIKTHLRAGGLPNHNETLLRGLRVRTNLKAGSSVPQGINNHNETQVRTPAVRGANLPVRRIADCQSAIQPIGNLIGNRRYEMLTRGLSA